MNEILGSIEIIDGEIITDTVGVCNIQWVNGYNELLWKNSFYVTRLKKTYY